MFEIEIKKTDVKNFDDYDEDFYHELLLMMYLNLMEVNHLHQELLQYNYHDYH
jgi:hypothetical protein